MTMTTRRRAFYYFRGKLVRQSDKREELKCSRCVKALVCWATDNGLFHARCTMCGKHWSADTVQRLWQVVTTTE